MFGLNFRRNVESTFHKFSPTKPFNLCGLRFLREPLQPLKRCPKWVCVEDAVKIINSGIYKNHLKCHLAYKIRIY